MIEKKGLQTQTWIIATILFSAVFAFWVMSVGSVNDNYGTTGIINPTIEARYNRLEDSMGLVDTIKNATKAEGGLSLIGGFRTLFAATLGVLDVSLNSLTLIPSTMFNFAEDFNLPSAPVNLFWTVIAMIITVLIVFSILNAGSGGRV